MRNKYTPSQPTVNFHDLSFAIALKQADIDGLPDDTKQELSALMGLDFLKKFFTDENAQEVRDSLDAGVNRSLKRVRRVVMGQVAAQVAPIVGRIAMMRGAADLEIPEKDINTLMDFMIMGRGFWSLDFPSQDRVASSVLLTAGLLHERGLMGPYCTTDERSMADEEVQEPNGEAA